MKKSLLVSLLALSGALTASVALADPIQLSDCPPVQTIAAHSQFRFAEELGNMWGFLTPGYQHNNKTWFTVMVLFKLPDVKTPEEALQKGQSYFNSHIQLTSPELKLNNICIYAVKSENYSVGALPEDNFENDESLRALQ